MRKLKYKLSALGFQLSVVIFMLMADSCPLPASTVDAQYSFTDYSTHPLNVKRLTVTPLGPGADYNGSILSQKPIIYTALVFPTMTNGTVTVTNLVAGYAYRVAFSDGFSEPTITNYFGTNLSGTVSGVTNRTAFINWQNGVAVGIWYQWSTTASGTVQTNISYLAVTNSPWVSNYQSSVRLTNFTASAYGSAGTKAWRTIDNLGVEQAYINDEGLHLPATPLSSMDEDARLLFIGDSGYVSRATSIPYASLSGVETMATTNGATFSTWMTGIARAQVTNGTNTIVSTNFVGNGSGLTNTSARRIFVRTNGNDTTAVKYSLGLAHQTLVAANIVAVPGDIVDAGPGLFSGTITNKSGVQYHFGAATIWSNGTPGALIHMDIGGTVDFTGRGKWIADTIFDTSPFGVSNIVGRIEAAEIHPVTTPATGFAMMLADGYDNISYLVTNGAGFVDLHVVADVAEIAFYSHIFSAAPLNRSVATNANYDLKIGRLKLNVGDEAQTNWTYNITAADFVIMSITGGSARYIVNGGKLISTNTWSHDAAGFAANTLVMNDVFLIGTNLPPTDYYHGIWRTNDTNIVIKAAQFIGNQYGALHFFNTGSPQAVNAAGSPSPMINYTRAITNGFFSNKSSGLITNRNAGVFEIAFSATATATLLPTTFRIYTNTVATDIGGVVSAFGGDIGTAGVGILEIPAMTQIKLMLDGDDVTVSTASLIARRLQ